MRKPACQYMVVSGYIKQVVRIITHKAKVKNFERLQK